MNVESAIIVGIELVVLYHLSKFSMGFGAGRRLLSDFISCVATGVPNMSIGSLDDPRPLWLAAEKGFIRLFTTVLSSRLLGTLFI